MDTDTPGTPNSTITFDEFTRPELHVGVIQRAARSSATKPSYRLWIDFGELGVRKSSAQITGEYELDDLPGTRVVAVTNLPPRQVGHFVSEVLVLAAVTADGTARLLTVDADVPPGTRVS